MSAREHVDRDLVKAVMTNVGYRHFTWGSYVAGLFAVMVAGIVGAVRATDPFWRWLATAYAVGAFFLCLTEVVAQRRWKEQTLLTVNALEVRLGLTETKRHREGGPADIAPEAPTEGGDAA